MGNRNIFFDLDGTLINNEKRLYELFTQLTKTNILQTDYLQLKRDMVSNEDIMRRFSKTDEEVDLFKTEWQLQIEEPTHLAKDEIFPFSLAVLQQLYSAGFTLFIVTARQSEMNTIRQVESLGLAKFMKDILITGHKSSKNDLIKDKDIKITGDDFFVGDTGIDIQCGKFLQMQTVAVLSGSRSREQLQKYAPDIIYNDIKEFAESLLKTITKPVLSL